MKLRVALGVVLLLLIAAAVMFGYWQLSGERAAEAQRDKPIMSASRVEQSTNGGPVVKLEVKTQKLIGLETEQLPAAKLPREIKGFGRVLDPTPLVGFVKDTATAQAALDASAKEYQRLKGLFERQRNASAHALESANAEMKRDEIALQAFEAQLLSGWGPAIAQQGDLPSLVQSLTQMHSALVRLDVPSGESVTQTPVGVRLLTPGLQQEVQGQYLGRAVTTDPQVQGQGFLLLVTNAPDRLVPGLVLEGFLQVPGEPLEGVVVPERALVRADERAWIYVQTDDTSFERKEVQLEYPMGSGWFVATGLSPGTRLVTTGAQALLSEERKGQIKAAD